MAKCLNSRRSMAVGDSTRLVHGSQIFIITIIVVKFILGIDDILIYRARSDCRRRLLQTVENFTRVVGG